MAYTEAQFSRPRASKVRLVKPPADERCKHSVARLARFGPRDMRPIHSEATLTAVSLQPSWLSMAVSVYGFKVMEAPFMAGPQGLRALVCMHSLHREETGRQSLLRGSRETSVQRRVGKSGRSGMQLADWERPAALLHPLEAC